MALLLHYKLYPLIFSNRSIAFSIFLKLSFTRISDTFPNVPLTYISFCILFFPSQYDPTCKPSKDPAFMFYTFHSFKHI